MAAAPLGRSLEDRVLGLHALALEVDGAARGRPDDCLTGGHRDPNAGDFEEHHRSIPEEKLDRRQTYRPGCNRASNIV